MIVTYSPQLENPPRDKEVILGFSFIGERSGSSEYVQFKSGVNRDVDAETWAKVKEMPLVAELLQLGALTVTEDVEVVTAGSPPRAAWEPCRSRKRLLRSTQPLMSTCSRSLITPRTGSASRTQFKSAFEQSLKEKVNGGHQHFLYCKVS